MGFLLDIYGLAAGVSFMATLVKIGMILYNVFAIIGVIATISFFVQRKRTKSERAEKRWLKTGKWK